MKVEPKDCGRCFIWSAKAEYGLRFLAGQSGGLPVGHRYFNLPQQVRHLLRRVLLLSHHRPLGTDPQLGTALSGPSPLVRRAFAIELNARRHYEEDAPGGGLQFFDSIIKFRRSPFQRSSPVELRRNAVERSPSHCTPQGIALRAEFVVEVPCATGDRNRVVRSRVDHPSQDSR